MTLTPIRRALIGLVAAAGLVLAVGVALWQPLSAQAQQFSSRGADAERSDRTQRGWSTGSVVGFRDKLLGTWQSPTPTLFPVGDETIYLMTTVSFDEQREWLTFVAYTDPELTQPLLQYDSEGVYVLRQPTATLPNTWDIDLTNDQQYVTLLQDRPDIAAQVGLDDCNPVVGETFDTSSGCWRELLTVSTCIDHDVVSVRGNELRFGGPEANRCYERPTTRSTDPLVRTTSWR